MKNIKKFHMISGIIVAILGTLLHFTYEWSGNNRIVGIFSAINESTWEHLKLLFFPMLLTTLIGYFYIGKDYRNYICARTIAIIVSMLFTITFFYTYSGVLGKVVDWINILSFFLAFILGEYVSYRVMISNFKCNKILACIILTVIYLLFVIFTFEPLNIGLFEDPTKEGLYIECSESLIF